MIIIGIDNGVSGSIGIIDTDNQHYSQVPPPTIKQLSYTRKKQYITRINVFVLKKILTQKENHEVRICIERPMINPTRFKASMSAIRALEATLIVIEELGYSYQYIDSKKWQKVMLPHGIQKQELKIASRQIGKRLFPNIVINSKQDYDGILIAEYFRRTLMGV